MRVHHAAPACIRHLAINIRPHCILCVLHHHDMSDILRLQCIAARCENEEEDLKFQETATCTSKTYNEFEKEKMCCA